MDREKVGKGAKSSVTWADLVSDRQSDLSFVDIPESAVVDDVLRIPKEVVDKGREKLQSAVIAQFIGTPPPLRVFAAMARRLWEATPEWVLLKKVPPVLITVEGISWVSSKIGKPLNKYVREGVNVRVCVLRDQMKPCPEAVKVEVEENEVETIEVQSFQAREYKQNDSLKGKEAMPVNVEKVWVVKEHKQVSEASVSGEKAMPDAPGDSEIVAVASAKVSTPSSENVAVASASSAGSGTSKTKKRRKNRKKNLDKALQAVSASQPNVLPASDAGTGNASASPSGGTEAPESSVVVQGVGGGPGNDSEASVQVEESPGQLGNPSSPELEIIPEIEGRVESCTEEEAEASSDEMPDKLVESKNSKKVFQKVFSGVKTRKNKRR
ncbi:hypothetical protein LINPERPRIM_LOCUS38971 [Linum perenne]